jgi:thermostable 8-oxoguanine DNA glycosylase
MRITNPQAPILFDRTAAELEHCLLFCIVVAGKKASIQIKLLQNFLESGSGDSPFEIISNMDAAGELADKLRDARLGQYTRLMCCFRELVRSNIDLLSCTVEDLENIHGIGPKTARFFMTCNRSNVRHAVIDTHLLKFMSQYLNLTVPTTTPGSKKEYSRLEEEWLKYVDKVGVNPAELDLAVWKIYANRDDSDYKRLVGNSSNAMFALNI